MTSSPDPFPRTSRFVQGYDVDQVDDFVASVLAALGKRSGTSVTAWDARNIVFRRAFGGYAPDAVDHALDRWAEQLPE